jgi:repressor LexA
MEVPSQDENRRAAGGRSGDLAFIHYYTKIHGRGPAEADLQRYFEVSPPAVHRMVVALEERGFLERTPGRARSIRLLIDRADIPDLE